MKPVTSTLEMPTNAPRTGRPALRRQPMPQVAVAGCGYWGRNLVRVFNSLGALRRICEPASAGIELANQIAPALPVSPEFTEALTDPDVQGVVIATPAETHAELIAQALEAGK